MSWLRRFLCKVGWHSLVRQPPQLSPEDAAKQMAEAKSGFEIVGILLVGAFQPTRWRCRHCDCERVT